MTKLKAAAKLLAEARSQRLLTYAAVALLLIVAIALAGKDLARYLADIEAWIAALGPVGVLAFLCLFILATTLLVPESLLSIMAGALFGLKMGLAVVMAGTLIAATLQYALSKKLLHARIEKTVAARSSLLAIQRAVRRKEFRLQAMLRLSPLNPATVSYLLGAAGVRFSGFLLACLALTPHLALEVYFGYASKNVAQMAGRSAKAVLVHDIVVFSGFAIIVAVVILVSRMAHKSVMEAVAD